MPNSANLYFQFVNNNQQQWNGPSVIRAAPNTPRKQTIKKSVSSLSFATTIGGEGQVWERPVMLAASANVYLVPLQKFSVFQQIFISWIGQHNQFCVETRAWIFFEKFSEIFCNNNRPMNSYELSKSIQTLIETVTVDVSWSAAAKTIFQEGKKYNKT